MASLRSIDRRALALAVLVALLQLVVLVELVQAHPVGSYGVETDFYDWYGPDAARIAAGQFPEHPYGGPGYPALIAVAAGVTGADVFTCGKWISAVSAVVAGGLAFMLFARLFGGWVGLGAQLLLAVAGQWPRHSFCAATDVPFLVPCLAVLVVLAGAPAAPRRSCVVAGALAALAYLTRYNGLFLVATGLIALLVLDLFKQDWKRRLVLAALFLGAFVVVASPWLVVNTMNRGSPFYRESYINIATEFYGDLAPHGGNLDGMHEVAAHFHSTGEVLRHDPARLLAHYPHNLYRNVSSSIRGDLVSQAVGWLGVAGLLWALLERRPRAVLLLVCAVVCFDLLMAVTHWEPRYHFFVAAMYCGFAVWVPVHLLARARALGWLRARAFGAIPAVCVVALAGLSLAGSWKEVEEVLADQPLQLVHACDHLDPGRATRILARKPHLPYLCHKEWVFFPQLRSLEELRAWLVEHPVDHVEIGPAERRLRPEIARALADPQTAPPWLVPVWSGTEPADVVYRTAP